MRKAILFAAAMIMVGCMSPEERKIAEYLNSRVETSGEHVSSVEIISSDSVLSVAMMGMMYNDCLRLQATGQELGEAYDTFNNYYMEAETIRNKMKVGERTKKEGHTYEWRKIDQLRVKYDGKERTDIEVVHDVDGSIMMTGREYDQELASYMYKLLSLQ